MNRPWRDCAARNIRISASAKYFRKNGGQGVCLFQIAKFQRAGKAAPQIRFPYGATGPPALSGCTVRHRQATSGGPVLQAVGHFCAQKRAARICMRRRRRHPLAHMAAQSAAAPYAKRLDAARIFAWARVCVCTNDASAPLANRRGCAGFAARTMCRQGTPPSCASHDACAGTHLFMGLPASISPSIGACASMLCLQAF